METPTLLSNFCLTVGKTVKSVRYDYYDLLILFTDGTVIRLELESQYVYINDTNPLDYEELYGLGLISDAERNRQRELERQEGVKLQEDRERKEYERLKKKFGS